MKILSCSDFIPDSIQPFYLLLDNFNNNRYAWDEGYLRFQKFETLILIITFIQFQIYPASVMEKGEGVTAVGTIFIVHDLKNSKSVRDQT